MNIHRRLPFTETLTKKAANGFSLIELSIVLTIIAILAGSALSLGSAKTRAAKYEQTAKKLDLIEKSLASYLAIKGRLPCPAESTDTITDANFGVERVDTTPDPDVCTKKFHNSHTWIGVIPVRTLQLPDELMFDGWGRRITYAVDERFITKCATSSSSGCFQIPVAPQTTTNNVGEITVRTTISGALSANIRSPNAVYVLISHGEDGHGAYTRGGTILDTGTTNADEIANAQTGSPDNVFVQKNRTGDRSNPANYFDDLTRYREKWQAVRDAGGLLNDDACLIAKEVIEDTPTNVCSGSAYVNCTNFVSNLASKINDFCLQ